MISISMEDAFAAALAGDGALWMSGLIPRSVAAGGVSTDSRTVRAGELFVALSGPNFRGVDFVESALARGAAGVIAEVTPGLDCAAAESDRRELQGHLAPLSRRYGVPIALCSSTDRALGRIAAHVRSTLKAPVIAITGSSGKTSTKSVLAHMLSAGRGEVVASPASFNNHVGVPHSLFLTSESTRFAVLEVGTNAPGEIAALGSIAQPDVAMITNIGRAHLEGLGSVEGIAEEKGALLDSVRPSGSGSLSEHSVVLSSDCPMTPVLEARVRDGLRIWRFSGAGQEADVSAHKVRTTHRGTEFELVLSAAALDASGLAPSSGSRAGSPVRGQSVVVPLLGAHAATNVAAALAGVIALGGDVAAAIESLGELRAEPHRLEPTQVAGVLVIDDAYNANPESFRAAIATLESIEGPDVPLVGGEGEPRRKPARVLVAGPMGEMGEDHEALHREIGRVAGFAGLDRLILMMTQDTSADAAAVAAFREGAIEAGMDPECIGLAMAPDVAALQLTTPAKVADRVIEPLMHGDVCLVKASRTQELERVVEALCDRLSIIPAAAPAAPGGSERSLPATPSPRDRSAPGTAPKPGGNEVHS